MPDNSDISLRSVLLDNRPRVTKILYLSAQVSKNSEFWSACVEFHNLQLVFVPRTDSAFTEVKILISKVMFSSLDSS
jgi:hypothetical protein